LHFLVDWVWNLRLYTNIARCSWFGEMSVVLISIYRNNSGLCKEAPID